MIKICYQQVLEYNPELADSFFCWKISDDAYLEFLEIYQHRPIRVNISGMRFHGNFFLWYLMKLIQPSLAIGKVVCLGDKVHGQSNKQLHKLRLLH